MNSTREADHRCYHSEVSGKTGQEGSMRAGMGGGGRSRYWTVQVAGGQFVRSANKDAIKRC